jgi:hypothetical protein
VFLFGLLNDLAHFADDHDGFVPYGLIRLINQLLKDGENSVGNLFVTLVAELISKKLSKGSQLIQKRLFDLTGIVLRKQGQARHECVEVFMLKISLDKVLQVVAEVKTVLSARLCENFEDLVDLGPFLFLIIDDAGTAL